MIIIMLLLLIIMIMLGGTKITLPRVVLFGTLTLLILYFTEINGFVNGGL